MKVLLPVYAMEDAKLITDFVENHLWPPTTNFKFLHVVENCETADEAEAARASGQLLVDELALALRTVMHSAEVTAEVVPGQASHEIIKMALSWRANIVVMGYRARQTIERILAGSVSKNVAVQAPCSVTIVRAPVAVSDIVPTVSVTVDSEPADVVVEVV